jgi:hypothetical protein
MDYGKLVGDSFAYAKDGLVGNPGTWVMLLILTMIPAIPIFCWILGMVLLMAAAPNVMLLAAGFGVAIILAVLLSAFYAGYQMKILRGDNPLPAVTGFSTLFNDGIRYLIIHVIYMIPAIIVFCVTVLPSVFSLMTAAMAGETPEAGAIVLGMIGGILATIVIGFIIGLFSLIGLVRFSRTGVFNEAFNFGAIRETIGKIGWGTYIIALLVMGILVMIASVVPGLIPIVGGIFQIIITPFIGVFSMRYICLLYESAENH